MSFIGPYRQSSCSRPGQNVAQFATSKHYYGGELYDHIETKAELKAHARTSRKEQLAQNIIARHADADAFLFVDHAWEQLPHETREADSRVRLLHFCPTVQTEPSRIDTRLTGV